MKTLFTLLLFSSCLSYSQAQCSAVQNAVSSSTDTTVQLYTNAFFVMAPGFANTYYWDLTDFNNTVLDQDTVTTNLALLTFNIALTDSMQICQTAINSITNVVCTVCDTLVYGGAVRGWELVGSNSGVILGQFNPATPTITIYPNPTTAILYLEVEGIEEYTTTLYDVQGRIVLFNRNNNLSDLKGLPKGLYFLVLQDVASGQKITKKVVKE